MKPIKYLYILLLLTLFSCEEKIELQPENSEQKVAVEAIFADFPSVSYVKLSLTKGIYEGILNHQVISDADVKIIDLTTQDTIHYVYSTSDAKYHGATPGIPGHTYRLEILTQGQKITSTKTMTEPVTLERVLSEPTGKQPDEYFLKMKFNDPPGKDYYLMIMQPMDPNAGLEMRFTVMSDLTYNPADKTLAVPQEVFHKDEDWLVLFFHIDRENYNYLKVMERAMRSLVNGAHPFYGLSLGNPVSTVHGEQAIGHFVVSPVGLSPIRIGN